MGCVKASVVGYVMACVDPELWGALMPKLRHVDVSIICHVKSYLGCN